MTDRRRSPRYVFLTPVGGHARAVSDCVVETWDGDDLVILAPHAASPGTEFVMHVNSSTGAATVCAVHVVSSTPEMASDALRFRLHVTARSDRRDRRNPPAASP